MKRGFGWLVACLVLASLPAVAGEGKGDGEKTRGQERMKRMEAAREARGARKDETRQGREGRSEEASQRREAHQQHREQMQKERKAHWQAMKEKRKAFRETMKGMEPQQKAQALHGFVQGMFAENNTFFEEQHKKRNAFFNETVSGEGHAERRKEHLERMGKRHEAITTHRKAEQEKTLALLQDLARNPELTQKGLHEALQKRRRERKDAKKALLESLNEERPGGEARQEGLSREKRDTRRPQRLQRPSAASDDPDDFSDLFED